MRYDRLLAELADMNGELARRLHETEEELARLRDELGSSRGDGVVRIAVLHPQTAFTRGGAELHTEALVRALREAGHEAEEVDDRRANGIRRPSSRIRWPCGEASTSPSPTG